MAASCVATLRRLALAALMAAASLPAIAADPARSPEQQKQDEVLRYAADSGRLLGAGPRCGATPEQLSALRDRYLDRLFSDAAGQENFRAAQERFERARQIGETGVVNDTVCRNLQAALETLKAQ